MKVLQFLLPAIAGLISIINVQAQTVDEIISKYIDAIGGKDKISSITSMYIEGEAEVMGNTIPLKIYVLNGKGYKMEMNINGSAVVQCITGKGGWGINQLTGQANAVALPDSQVRSSQTQLYIGGPLVDYAAKGNIVELLGKDDIDGTECFKLKVTTRNSVQITIFIDPSTFYVIKTTVSGHVMETTTTFSNFQKTDYGFVVPFSQEISTTAGSELGITDKKVEINKDIDPSVFEMPKN